MTTRARTTYPTKALFIIHLQHLQLSKRDGRANETHDRPLQHHTGRRQTLERDASSNTLLRMMESMSREGRFARGAREYRDALNGFIGILKLPGILRVSDYV
jgi:transposase